VGRSIGPISLHNAIEEGEFCEPDCERVRRGVSEQEIDALFEELGFLEVFEGLAPSPFE
jgi:hypothetical protein